MGSPISGLFADIIMDDLETACLSKLSFNPIFFYRYVDDIITCIPSHKIDETLTIFNSYNNSTFNFTHEIESANSISFLDVLVINNNGRIKTDWYTKPTFSGRFLNYLSQHPITNKIVMVYNIVDRAIKLADKEFYIKNIRTAEELLIDNNYPTDFVNKYVGKRLSTIYSNEQPRQNNNLILY